MNSCCGTNTAALESPPTRMVPSSTATNGTTPAHEAPQRSSSSSSNDLVRPKARQNLFTEFRLPPKKRRVYETDLDASSENDEVDDSADHPIHLHLQHQPLLGSSNDAENIEFWRSGSYSIFPTPPKKLRRQVASCWFPSTGEHGFKNIITQPPSSGSPYYNERYGKRTAQLALYPHGPHRIGTVPLLSSSSSSFSFLHADSIKPSSVSTRMEAQQSRQTYSSNIGIHHIRHGTSPPIYLPSSSTTATTAGTDFSNDMELVSFNTGSSSNINNKNVGNTSCATAGHNSVTPSPNHDCTPKHSNRRIKVHHQQSSSSNSSSNNINNKATNNADTAVDHRSTTSITLESSRSLSVMEPASSRPENKITGQQHHNNKTDKNHTNRGNSACSSSSSTIAMVPSKGHRHHRRRRSSSTDQPVSVSSPMTTTDPRHNDTRKKAPPHYSTLMGQSQDTVAAAVQEQQKRPPPSSFTNTSSISNSAAATATAAATSFAAPAKSGCFSDSIDLIGKSVGGSGSKITVPAASRGQDRKKKKPSSSTCLPAPVAIRGQELPRVMFPPFPQHQFCQDTSNNNNIISFNDGGGPLTVAAGPVTVAPRMNGNNVHPEPSMPGYRDTRASGQNHIKHAQASQKKLAQQHEQHQAVASIFRPHRSSSNSFMKEPPVQDETLSVSSLPVGAMAFHKMNTTSSSMTMTAMAAVMRPTDLFVGETEVHPLASSMNSGRLASAFAPGGLGGGGQSDHFTLPVRGTLPIRSSSEQITGRVGTLHIRSSSDCHFSGRHHHHHQQHQQQISDAVPWMPRPSDCNQEPSPESYYQHPSNVEARRRVSSIDTTTISSINSAHHRRISSADGTASNTNSAQRRVSSTNGTTSSVNSAHRRVSSTSSTNSAHRRVSSTDATTISSTSSAHRRVSSINESTNSNSINAILSADVTTTTMETTGKDKSHHHHHG